MRGLIITDCCCLHSCPNSLLFKHLTVCFWLDAGSMLTVYTRWTENSYVCNKISRDNLGMCDKNKCHFSDSEQCEREMKQSEKNLPRDASELRQAQVKVSFLWRHQLQTTRGPPSRRGYTFSACSIKDLKSHTFVCMKKKMRSFYVWMWDAGDHTWKYECWSAVHVKALKH